MGIVFRRCLAGLLFIATLSVLLSTLACVDKGNEPSGSLNPGATPASYDYHGYDAAGALVVKGTLVLYSADTASAAGTWNLTAVAQSDKIGPQVGTGTLQGTITGSAISLNLNPHWADNNVILFGSFAEDRITGTWSWVTFVGPTAGGRFEAIRKS